MSPTSWCCNDPKQGCAFQTAAITLSPKVSLGTALVAHSLLNQWAWVCGWASITRQGKQQISRKKNQTFHCAEFCILLEPPRAKREMDGTTLPWCHRDGAYIASPQGQVTVLRCILTTILSTSTIRRAKLHGTTRPLCPTKRWEKSSVNTAHPQAWSDAYRKGLHS